MSQKVSIISKLIAIILLVTTLSMAKEVSAYYQAPYQSLRSIAHQLKKAGFRILKVYAPAKKPYLRVIVFTDDNLITLASQKKRGFAAILKLVVNKKTKQVRVMNPSYWLQAYLQKQYIPGSDSTVNTSLRKALISLKPTSDTLPRKRLASYHFMIGMPYYADMLEFPYKNKIRKRDVLFRLKLKNGSQLIGIRMPKSVEEFIETTGEENALILPYTILIEDGKVYALHGKYYIALSYPKLNMGKFIKMRSIPDKIEMSIKRIVR